MVGDDFGEPRPFGGREVEHLQALRLQADLGEQLPGPLDPPPRPQVAFEEVAAAFEAAGHDHAVDAALEGRQQVVHFELARAGQPQHADVARDTGGASSPARSAAAYAQ